MTTKRKQRNSSDHKGHFSSRFKKFIDSEHPRATVGGRFIDKAVKKSKEKNPPHPLGVEDADIVLKSDSKKLGLKAGAYKIGSDGEYHLIPGSSKTVSAKSSGVANRSRTKNLDTVAGNDGEIHNIKEVESSYVKPQEKPVKVKEIKNTRTDRKSTESSGSAPDLRDHLKLLGPEGRRIPETIKHIAENQTKSPISVRVHGMPDHELMHSVEFEGMRIHYPAAETVDFNHSAVRTISNLLVSDRLPENLTKSTTDVYLTSQKNGGDTYWARVYNRPDFRSAATGEYGQITVYRGEPATLRELTHEMGHNFASDKYQSTYPDQFRDFGKLQTLSRTKAVGAEQPPSDYGRSNDSEDFAESIRMYHTERDQLKAVAPKRYEIVKRLMEDESYGG